MSAANVHKTRQLKPGRKVRIPLSCEPCRARKLKCNREQPCQNCTVRENQAGCFFRGVEKPPVTGGTAKGANASGMQQRIDRLESLVTNLMAQGQVLAATATTGTNGNTPPEDLGSDSWDRSHVSTDPSSVPVDAMPAVQHGMGVMTVNGTSSKYRGTTHWHDLLSELSDLRNYWGQVQDEDGDERDLLQDGPVESSFEGPSLFCGIVQPVGMSEILASLPPKAATDRLMARFWDEENSPAPTFHILHKSTFMREYETHWANPRATPVMWVGLLFALLSQTMVSYYLCEDEPPEYEGISQSVSELYRLRTAQCLMLGDISKCVPYTLETMVYYTMVEWARIGRNEPRVWMMVGLLGRVGLQMGYHRDPSHYPKISVFHGEIRRRLWAFIHRTDALTSFLVGLPSMIRTSEQDVEEPRNLHEWELTEDMTELPPSRPTSEITPVSYLIAKGRILDVMGRIVDFMSSLKLWEYENVLILDQQLIKVFTEELPGYFKIPSDQDEGNNNPSIVNRRIQLAFLYHQGMCVLHRKFMAQGRADERFKPSRERGIESANALLEQQHYLWHQTEVEKSLASKSWYRVSYTSQEYILAAMIVVMELKQRGLEVFSGDLAARDRENKEMCKGLQRACLIWKDVKGSAEAVKVYKVLSGMLAKVGPDGHCLQGSLLSSTYGTTDGLEMQPEAALVPSDAAIDMDIDWSAWDTFIEGSSFEDVYGSVSMP